MANGAIYVGKSKKTGRRVFTTPYDLEGNGRTPLTAEFNDVAGEIDKKLNKDNNFGHRNWRAPTVEEAQMMARLKEELGLDQTLTNDMELNQFDYPGWYWTSETEGLAERYAKIDEKHDEKNAYCVQAFDGEKLCPPMTDRLSIRAVYDEEDGETLEVAATPKAPAKGKRAKGAVIDNKRGATDIIDYEKVFSQMEYREEVPAIIEQALKNVPTGEKQACLDRFLNLAVRWKYDEGLIEALLKAGADANGQAAAKGENLGRAIQTCQFQTAQVLYKYGARFEDALRFLHSYPMDWNTMHIVRLDIYKERIVGKNGAPKGNAADKGVGPSIGASPATGRHMYKITP